MLSIQSSAIAGSRKAPPFPIANKLSRTLQTVTGITAVTGWLSSMFATAALRHEVGGNSRVKLSLYSLSDLLAGKLKGADVLLRKASYRDVPISHLHLATASGFQVRAFKGRGKPSGLITPLLVKVDGTVSQADLTGALSSARVVNSLHMVKIELPGMGEQRLQFVQPRVNLLADKILLQSTVITAGAAPETGINLKVTGTPYIDGSRIAVKDLQIDSPDINSPCDFSRFVQPLVNPLVDLAKLDRKDHALRLTALSVSDGKAQFNGNLVLAPKAGLSGADEQVATRK